MAEGSAAQELIQFRCDERKAHLFCGTIHWHQPFDPDDMVQYCIDWRQAHNKIWPLRVLTISDLPAPFPPRFIHAFPQLRELFLYAARLHSIPAEIGLLTELTALDLRVNELERLPSTLTNLTALRVLLLSDNRVLAKDGFAVNCAQDNCQPQLAYIGRHYGGIERARERCQRAAAALYMVCMKRRDVPKDMARLLARAVWARHRGDVEGWQ